MNKRLVTLGLLILAVSLIGKLLFMAAKNIKVDDFHKAAVVFVMDSSASNQDMLPDEIKFTKSLCSILDPEDHIKILKVSQDSYLIYEGAPSDSKGITKAVEAFTKYDSKDYGTAYGEAIKKALDHCLTMKKEGFIPSKNIKNVQNYIPELAMMFVYAKPDKLDLVKTKLNPILGEKKLIVANEANVDKAGRRFLEAIGR